MKSLFKPDHERYEGVRPINLYVMKLYFLLMFLFVSSEAWQVIFTHEGSWDPTRAAAWCMWAAYSTLSLFGIYKTLKMLPIMVFMVLYKSTWLIAVALPLMRSGELAGSPAGEMAGVFSGVLIPLLFMPWTYVFRTFIQLKWNRAAVSIPAQKSTN